MKKGLILIPAYNESETIREVVASLPREIKGVPFDVLVIDDGSTDATATLVPQLPHVSVLQLRQNQGVGRVFQVGMKFALEHGYDYLINFDADMQFAVDDLEAVFEPVEKGKCVLSMGNRFHEGMRIPNMSWAKRVGNWGTAKLVSLIARRKFQDVTCGFRCYAREALYLLNLFSKFSYTHETILVLCEHNELIEEVPVKVTYSRNRISRVGKNLAQYGFEIVKLMMRTLVDFSPKVLWGSIALIFFLCSIIGGACVIGHYFQAGRITPYKWLAFLAAFLFGCGIACFLLVALTSSFSRMRKNQEALLYYLKRIYYD